MLGIVIIYIFWGEAHFRFGVTTLVTKLPKSGFLMLPIVGILHFLSFIAESNNPNSLLFVKDWLSTLWHLFHFTRHGSMRSQSRDEERDCDKYLFWRTSRAFIEYRQTLQWMYLFDAPGSYEDLLSIYTLSRKTFYIHDN